jgi:hypothetical protein
MPVIPKLGLYYPKITAPVAIYIERLRLIPTNSLPLGEKSSMVEILKEFKNILLDQKIMTRMG